VVVSGNCSLMRPKAWRSVHFCKPWGVRGAFHFLCLSLLILLLAGKSSQAQEIPSAAMEQQIKAAFLYKFCLYTEWPHTAFAQANSPFVFGIIAPVSFVRELNSVVRGRTVNKRPIEVREINEEEDLGGIHVVFLAAGTESGAILRLQNKANGLPLLVVAETESGLDDGAAINFMLKDNRVSFEVALDAAQRQGLHMSAEMLKVAGNVRGVERP
jgi:hypothetical protein